MRVGVTGHQKRDGADWDWVRAELARLLSTLDPPLQGLTSLAKGTDQLFALEVLAAGGTLHVVIPAANYESTFEGEALERFSSLNRASAKEILQNSEPNGEAFLQAGRRIVDEADFLVAVWDGLPARGLGGTADVVAYAQACEKRVTRIDPVSRKTEQLARY